MTAEQILEATEAILYVYASKGRHDHTKSVIRECWMNGNYWNHGLADRAGELQRLRNTTGGHEFLTNFTLPKTTL